MIILCDPIRRYLLDRANLGGYSNNRHIYGEEMIVSPYRIANQ